MINVKCMCCNDEFMAREAERKRGWAKFCSKSCAAYWKTYRRQRKHQTVEMMESAKFRNDIERKSRKDRAEENRGGEFIYVGGFGSWDDHKG